MAGCHCCVYVPVWSVYLFSGVLSGLWLYMCVWNWSSILLEPVHFFWHFSILADRCCWRGFLVYQSLSISYQSSYLLPPRRSMISESQIAKWSTSDGQWNVKIKLSSACQESVESPTEKATDILLVSGIADHKRFPLFPLSKSTFLWKLKTSPGSSKSAIRFKLHPDPSHLGFFARSKTKWQATNLIWPRLLDCRFISWPTLVNKMEAALDKLFNS